MPRLLLSSPAKRSTRVDAVSPMTTAEQQLEPADGIPPAARVKALSLRNIHRRTALVRFAVQTEDVPCDPLPCKLALREIPCEALLPFTLHSAQTPCDALLPFAHSTYETFTDEPPPKQAPVVLSAFKQDVSKIPSDNLLIPFTNNPQQIPQEELLSLNAKQQQDEEEILSAKRAILRRLEQEQKSVLSTVLAMKRHILLFLQNQANSAKYITPSNEQQVLHDKRAVLSHLEDRRVLHHKQSILTLLRTL